MNNTYRGLEKYQEEKMKVTNAFMKTLQISGYHEGFRKQVALSAFRGVARMEEREKLGGRKVYRYQSEGANDRHKARLGAKSSWQWEANSAVGSKLKMTDDQSNEDA